MLQVQSEVVIVPFSVPDTIFNVDGPPPTVQPVTAAQTGTPAAAVTAAQGTARPK